MKFLAIALAVSGLASASAIGAQTTRPTSSNGVLVPVQGSMGCNYVRSTSSVGDIIFGRTNLATNCTDVYSREDGAWYQVGRGRDNSSIYERRIRNANGNLVIQRARRSSNGRFTILSTRVATSNDKEWRKAQKAQQKAIKQQEKAERKAEREFNKNHR
jgi:hypothetical protein